VRRRRDVPSDPFSGPVDLIAMVPVASRSTQRNHAKQRLRRGIVIVAATAEGTRTTAGLPSRAWRGPYVLPRALVAVRSLLILLVIWQCASLWTGNPLLLPSPVGVVDALVDLLRSGELFDQASVSIARLMISLVVAMVLAIPLGLLMGLLPLVGEIIDPVIELLRPISGIAWIPLALFTFGIGGTLPIFIMSYAAFFPLLFNTIAGVRSVDARLVSAARSMGLRRSAIVLHVVLPASLPSVIVGLRLAIASGWTAIVAAELIGADSGVGFAIEWYRELLMSAKVLAFIVVIGLIGYSANLTITAVHRRLTPWAVTAELR